MMRMADTRIVGIVESRCVKVPDRSALQLRGTAVAREATDAGLALVHGNSGSIATHSAL